VTNECQGTNTNWPIVQIQSKREPSYLNVSRRIRRDEPFLFRQSGWSMNLKGGNSTAVAAAWINGRRIRYVVDGSDKEQQAY
jgi:hypothetical protein